MFNNYLTYENKFSIGDTFIDKYDQSKIIINDLNFKQITNDRIFIDEIVFTPIYIFINESSNKSFEVECDDFDRIMLEKYIKN